MSGARGLGTFGGVFTPSILTILGIILFLRHGWVVGSVGLRNTLALIFVAHLVSVLTSMSLAAIATNRRVKGGGDYFLISRSLGPEFGGALGLVLFLAQAVSVAFYCFGFGEAVAALLPEGAYLDARSLAVLAAFLLFGVALLGADLATRFQYVIMAIMSLALASFFLGAQQAANVATLRGNWMPPDGAPGFWIVFAIFFPAVTGFTQGVSMSGDLADAGRSLPRGTFSAVAVSFVVYTLAAVFFAMGAPGAALAADYEAFRRLSAWAPLFDAGVIAATLSSALAAFLGAPRILQAMARDGLFSILQPFGRGSGPRDNPRLAVGLVAAIAMVVFALGDLNTVARIISMFFLISYGLLNYATYVEAHGQSPSFRPRYRFFHARLSLLGSLVCVAAMLAIDPANGAIAIVVVTVIYQYLRRRQIAGDWADSRPAYNFRRLKDTIREIDRLPANAWSWHPNILIFGENSERRDLLAHFGSELSGDSGIAVSVGIVEGEGDFASSLTARRELEQELRDELDRRGLDAFPLVLAAPDMRVAVSTLLQTWGIGPVQANTVLLDWWEHLPESSGAADPRRYGRQLTAILRLGCHVLIMDVTGREFRDLTGTDSVDRRIDVWWWEESSCRLSLLLAYLMTRCPAWEGATIRLLAPCQADDAEKLERRLAAVLDEGRIDATVEMIPDGGSTDIVDWSEDSAMVLFPMRLEGMRVVDPFGNPLEDILPQLPITCIVGAADKVKIT